MATPTVPQKGPSQWTREEINSFDVRDASEFDCPNCKQLHRRYANNLTLRDDYDGDDDCVERFFYFKCMSCGFAWDSRDDELAPDWNVRVN